MSEAFLQTVGLREALKYLKVIGRTDIIKELKKSNAQLSGMLITAARANASTPQERAASQRALVAVKSELPAIRLARNKFPAVTGAEYGAYRNKFRSTKHGPIRGWRQFRDWRGHKENTGYFMWPAIRQNSEKIAQMYAEELSRIWGGL